MGLHLLLLLQSFMVMATVNRFVPLTNFRQSELTTTLMTFVSQCKLLKVERNDFKNNFCNNSPREKMFCRIGPESQRNSNGSMKKVQHFSRKLSTSENVHTYRGQFVFSDAQQLHLGYCFETFLPYNVIESFLTGQMCRIMNTFLV